jgi:hypothetical protein
LALKGIQLKDACRYFRLPIIPRGLAMKRPKKVAKHPKRPSAKRKSAKQSKKAAKKSPVKEPVAKKTARKKAVPKRPPVKPKAAKPEAAKSKKVTTGATKKMAMPASLRTAAMPGAPDAAVIAKVDPLKLASWAHEAALIMAAEFPTIDFTSGRRDMAAQARAMAGNVAASRSYIEDTYADTAESRSLQKWVDDHPGATTAGAITEGLKSVMKDWTDDQLAKISRHIAGLAFDVQPIGEPGASAVKNRMKTLPHLQKPPIFDEGGLVRWHAQFKSKIEDPGDS